MRKSRLVIIALLLLFLMGGCYRGYNQPRYSDRNGQECTSENPDDCQPNSGYHGCGRW
jgi:hypothetical protein